jgi:nicotinamidase-related amidase
LHERLTIKTTVTPQPGDALLIVDVQSDFLPGGALAVPRGGEVIAPLNQYIAAFTGRGLPVFATRDWHPANHCSFKERGWTSPPTHPASIAPTNCRSTPGGPGANVRRRRRPGREGNRSFVPGVTTAGYGRT